jgi:hypothetical protein
VWCLLTEIVVFVQKSLCHKDVMLSKFQNYSVENNVVHDNLTREYYSFSNLSIQCFCGYK